MKLAQPQERLAAAGQARVEDFDAQQVKGISALEVLAAVGLILPAALDLVLTALAAAGVVLLMLGAGATHLAARRAADAARTCSSAPWCCSLRSSASARTRSRRSWNRRFVIAPRQRAGVRVRYVRECPFPDMRPVENPHRIEVRTAQRGGLSGRVPRCSAYADRGQVAPRRRYGVSDRGLAMPHGRVPARRHPRS
jgi:hypothetical protein